MNSTEDKTRTFIAYDYKEVVTTYEKASFFIDSYENFGWEIDGNITPVALHTGSAGQLSKTVVLRFKRNRKIINKMELTRLQRNFQSCIHEIDELEQSKKSTATVTALITGLIGTVFMALSVFAVVAVPPNILFCILFAVPGFLGWILPYFLYRTVLEKQTKKVAPYIEAKYDEIYEICEKGSRILFEKPNSSVSK